MERPEIAGRYVTITEPWLGSSGFVSEQRHKEEEESEHIMEVGYNKHTEPEMLKKEGR